MLVFEHDLAVDEVPDLPVAVNFDLHRHPTIAVIRLRPGVVAVLG